MARVFLVIMEKRKKIIKFWNQISHRLLQTDIDLKNYSLTVIAAYDNDPATKNYTFFFDLMTVLEKIENRGEVPET